MCHGLNELARLRRFSGLHHSWFGGLGFWVHIIQRWDPLYYWKTMRKEEILFSLIV
jgi:hypothetical protein